MNLTENLNFSAVCILIDSWKDSSKLLPENLRRVIGVLYH